MIYSEFENRIEMKFEKAMENLKQLISGNLENKLKVRQIIKSFENSLKYLPDIRRLDFDNNLEKDI